MDFCSPLHELNGIGEKTEKKLQKLGVYTLGDILLNFPRAYVKYPRIMTLEEIANLLDLHEKDPFNYDNPLQEPVAILGRLKTPAIQKKFYKNGAQKNLTLATIFTEMGSFEGVWFNSPHIRGLLEPNLPFVFYGKLQFDSFSRFKMDQPVVFTPEKYRVKEKGLQPLYALTFGVSNNLITKTVSDALEVTEIPKDYLPQRLLIKRNLLSKKQAISTMHFPEDMDSLIQSRRRLVYDEFFQFLLQLQLQKDQKSLILNDFVLEKDQYFHRILSQLPFSLTQGQKEALESIRDDFNGEYITERLLQGDVGSGKTIIAFLLMSIFAENGYQSAIMAPTEVLAQQHYKTFIDYINAYQLPFDAVLLVGSMSASEKKKIYARMISEPGLFVIGTHALIQEKAQFLNLGFVVTDEQHRFGVKQRRELSEKGLNPHILVMSATPIPRTLALILYGDMKLSVIRDVPARRLPIKNAVIKKNQRKTSYQFIAKQIKEGRQAYVICPLIESTEKSEGENVTEYVEKLRSFYGDSIAIGLLHGKMKPKEKNEIMEAFAEHRLDILVSTTVIEVGINVPNASVMLIEDANRFGLAQLHQLRGRVGRGDAQSYCIFVDGTEGDRIAKRLEILSSSNDGFQIAEEDLKLRGPGDFYGIRQSGDFGFQLADIYQDSVEMQWASEDVMELLESKEELEQVLSLIQKQSQSFYTNLSFRECPKKTP